MPGRRTTSAVHVVGKNRKEGPILTEHKMPHYSSSGKKQIDNLEFLLWKKKIRICLTNMFTPDQSRTGFFIYTIVIVLESECINCFYVIDKLYPLIPHITFHVWLFQSTQHNALLSTILLEILSFVCLYILCFLAYLVCIPYY